MPAMPLITSGHLWSREKSRRNQSMYLALFSLNIVALLLASMKSSVMSLKRKWLVFNSKDIFSSVNMYILPYVIFDNIWSATDFSLQRRRVTIVICIAEKIIHLNSCRGEKLHCIPQGCAKSFKLDLALRMDLCLSIWPAFECHNTYFLPCTNLTKDLNRSFVNSQTLCGCA